MFIKNWEVFMAIVVPNQNGVVPQRLENQENRNIPGEAEVLYPALQGDPALAESSPFVEMLNRTALGSGREVNDAFIESGSRYIQEKQSKWELSKTEANNDWFLVGALKAFFIFMSRGDELVTHAEKDRTPLRNPVEATPAITYLAELNKQGIDIDISDYAQSRLDNAGLSEDADKSEGRDPLAFARGFTLGQPEGAVSRQAALQEFERALSATIALAPDLDAQKQIVAAAVHNVALEAGIISSEGAVNDEDGLEYLTTQMNSLWVKSSPVAGGTSYAVLKFAEQIAKGFDPNADNFSDIIETVNRQTMTMAVATVTNSSDAGKVLEVKAQFKAQIWGALLGNETFTSKMRTSLTAIYKEVEELHDLSKTTDAIAESFTGRISHLSQQDSRVWSSDTEFGLHLAMLEDQMPSAMFDILRGFQGAFNPETEVAEMRLDRILEIAPSLSREVKPVSGAELLTAMGITKNADGEDIRLHENGGDIYTILDDANIITDENGEDITGFWSNKKFTSETLRATLECADWSKAEIERLVSNFDSVSQTVVPYKGGLVCKDAEELLAVLKHAGIPADQAQVIADNFNPDTQMVDIPSVIANAKGRAALPRDMFSANDFLAGAVREYTDAASGQVNIFKVFSDPMFLSRAAILSEKQNVAQGQRIKEDDQAKTDLFKRWFGYASTNGIMRQYQEMHTYFSESDSHIHGTVEAYNSAEKEARLEELKAHKEKLSNLVSNLAGSEAEAAFESLGFQEISAIDDSPLYNQHNLPMEKYCAMLEEALGLDHGAGTGSPTAAAELIEFLTLGVAAYLLITEGRVSHEVYSQQRLENTEFHKLHLEIADQLKGLTSQDVDAGKSVSFSIQGREITLSHWADEEDLQVFKNRIREVQRASEALFSRNAPLGSYHSAVGATYAEGVVGENVCDWSHVDPAGFSMVFDGVGHDDPDLVAMEHPLYGNFASDHARFVRETEVTSKEQYAEALDGQVANYNQRFAALRSEYEEAAERYSPIMVGLSNQILKNVAAGNPALSEEEFQTLTELISRQKFEDALRKPDTPQLARDCMQAILDKDFEAFNRHAALYKGVDQRRDFSMMFFDKLRYKNAGKGTTGPAFGIAQFFKAEDQDHLYLNRVADVCFMVIQPKGQERSVDLQDISPDQVTWVEESTVNANGLGEVYGQAAEKGKVMAVRPGTIVMTFSDGIGEFLTQEEVLEVIQEGHSLDKFKAKITEESHRQKGREQEDETRKRASHSTVGCKPYNPEDSGFHDDVSYSWMVLK